MYSHVTIQISALAESKMTQMTLVWLFATVNAKMFGQRGTVGKGFSTHETPVDHVLLHAENRNDQLQIF